MKRLLLILVMLPALLSSCVRTAVTGTLDGVPCMFPDYSGVTVPRSIAPLNFGVDAPAAFLVLTGADRRLEVKGPDFDIPVGKWHELISAGEEVEFTIIVRDGKEWKSCPSFKVYLSDDEIDSHIAYRLIAPGYESWNSMGIYQRDLSDFTEKAIITNESTDKNCMNCHSFAGHDPDRMVFHMRAKNGGTYVTDGNDVMKLNTKTPQTISAGVYPQWSDDGRFIAFSVNDIWQVFHSTDRDRIEVYDEASDVVVYDSETQELVSSPLLMQDQVLETFPTFSPDGRTLYFCTSQRQNVPEDYDKIRYSICAISFDPENDSFGERVDTVLNCSKTGLNATFPRVSPDGRLLMFSGSNYGCFNIWHQNSDLYVVDLQTREVKRLDAACSEAAESYHGWSSNGKWFVFGSRRMDGLYTRPYICHIEPDGSCSKPFVLPQRNPGFYHDSFLSYNIPEFIDGPVTIPEAVLAGCARNDKAIELKLRQ